MKEYSTNVISITCTFVFTESIASRWFVCKVKLWKRVGLFFFLDAHTPVSPIVFQKYFSQNEFFQVFFLFQKCTCQSACISYYPYTKMFYPFRCLVCFSLRIDVHSQSIWTVFHIMHCRNVLPEVHFFKLRFFTWFLFLKVFFDSSFRIERVTAFVYNRLGTLLSTEEDMVDPTGYGTVNGVLALDDPGRIRGKENTIMNQV